MERKIYIAKTAGMSLIELMVTIAIMGIVLGIGLPASRAMVQDNTLTSTYNKVINLTSYARNQASKRNASTVTLCKSSNGTSCSDASSGFKLIVFVDNNQNGTLNTNDLLLKETAINSTEIKLTLSDFTNNKILFLASGRPTQTGGIMICDNRGSPIHGLVMNISGQVRKATASESSCS